MKKMAKLLATTMTAGTLLAACGDNGDVEDDPTIEEDVDNGVDEDPADDDMDNDLDEDPADDDLDDDLDEDPVDEDLEDEDVDE